MRKILSRILLAVFLSSLILFLWVFWKDGQKEMSVVKMEKELQEYVTPPPDVPEGQPEGEYGFDWNGLVGVNPDVKGWIRFDNPARISYPILQASDNQFYLDRNWDGSYLFAGSIFLHKANSPDFSDQNSVIYGHRMIGGSMFGDLGYYASQAFLDENPYFYIYTPDGKKRTYEIYAYAEVADGSDSYELHFGTAEERGRFYQALQGHILASRQVALGEYDTTVTLSTCTDYGVGSSRMILQAKLIGIEVNQLPQ